MLSGRKQLNTHRPIFQTGKNAPRARQKTLKVLAVDDSNFFLRALTRALGSIDGIEVAATASNGRQALKMARELKPDLITLDLEMPEMDGLQTLREIQKRRLKTRVIMVSAHTSAGAKRTIEALELGAESFITKPSSTVGGNKVDYLIEQLKATIGITETKVPVDRLKLKPALRNLRRDLVLVAASTGGPRALADFFRSIPRSFAGTILMVQHMPPIFTRTLAERLDRLSHLEVAEGVDGEKLLPGRAYLAPGGFHMEVEMDKGCPRIKIHEGARIHGCRPAADVLFSSVAPHFGKRCQVIVMTGMGRDGAAGARAVRDAGGLCYGQDESTCTVWGMPRFAWESGFLEELLPLQQLAAHMAKNAAGRG